MQDMGTKKSTYAIIDTLFKDADPVKTVENIESIINGLGFCVEERWIDSGLDNCYSLQAIIAGTAVSSNGKGITRELARASAYGELIERLQSGLCFYKKESMEVANPGFSLQSYAPDGRYMTKEEMIADGEWMDDILKNEKGGPTRKNLVDIAFTLAGGGKEGKILNLPYYSIFEDKYFYLPAHFIKFAYTSNGSCAGNTAEEAWVHAISEIYERHFGLNHLRSGKPAPEIPANLIKDYKTVNKIIRDLREKSGITVKFLDFSDGCGYPVVGTLFTDKATHSYRIKVACDPVLEIAIERTLTEGLQGRNIKKILTGRNRKIETTGAYSCDSNIRNQLESSSGYFNADFFAPDFHAATTASVFKNNIKKTNKTLITEYLDTLRRENRRVLVRNYSFLGFPCYKFIIPGFSETFDLNLSNPLPDYLLADMAAKILKDVRHASNSDLALLLAYLKTDLRKSVRYDFSRLCGIPMIYCKSYLIEMHCAYAAWRTGNYNDMYTALSNAANFAFKDADRDLAECLLQYFELKKSSERSEEEIAEILSNLFCADTINRIKENYNNYGDGFGDVLLRCDLAGGFCDTCKYKQYCTAENTLNLIAAVGEHYGQFITGQSRENFNVASN